MTFFPSSGNDNKWAHASRTCVPQGALEHSQGLERSKPVPQWELPEGNISSWASLTNDPWPSSWLAGENLKMPIPPFWLRASVWNCITPCFLWELSCISGRGHGGDTGSLSLVPPAHATHSPVADHCHPRVLVQLTTTWAPTCWKRVKGECRETQGCHFPWGTPTAAKQGLPQSSCCLWASWTFDLPANTARRYDMAPHVVGEEQGMGAQNANVPTDAFHVDMCWNGEMLKVASSWWCLTQAHCICPCSFSSPFQLCFHLQYKNLAHLVLRYWNNLAFFL